MTPQLNMRRAPWRARAGAMALGLGAALFGAAPTNAGTPEEITIDWYVIANGGENVTNGVITLEGTIGQAGAGLTAFSPNAASHCPQNTKFASGYWYAAKNVCIADFNQDGVANIDDVFIHINAWFTQNPRTDTDCNGVVGIDDIFIFINLWFAGC